MLWPAPEPSKILFKGTAGSVEMYIHRYIVNDLFIHSKKGSMRPVRPYPIPEPLIDAGVYTRYT